MDDEQRDLAKVPLTLIVIMGAFLLVAAVIALAIWAL